MFVQSPRVLGEHLLYPTTLGPPSSTSPHWGLSLLGSTLLDLGPGNGNLGGMCGSLSSLCLQDLIIFPDDCEFKRVPQCPSGRVYVLKFKAGSKRLFFWMQVCRRMVHSVSTWRAWGS